MIGTVKLIYFSSENRNEQGKKAFGTQVYGSGHFHCFRVQNVPPGFHLYFLSKKCHSREVVCVDQ